jgi:cation diffusion facilitator CzcD-associated flavoprotein CzcO
VESAIETSDGNRARAELPSEVDVAIVGAGFSGLGMAIHLRREGRDDFVVLERADEVGGTWWFNTYPGCACDVPSHLYSFSFAPNPDWTQTYSPQPEIRDYLRRCADRFAVRDRIRFGCEVTGARWDSSAERWRVETSDGELSARILVSAMGPLVEPKLPELPGLEGFEGRVFHSARWDHDYDLDGKRVAAIGTGASAIQFVPEIQPHLERLHVFQRTPPWVLPHSNRPITDGERWLYRRFPALQRLARGFTYMVREPLVLGFAKNPRLMRIVERLARRHIAQQVPDPELRAKVTPDYAIGCKRILPSNRWYPALGEPNVELVTDPIVEVRANSVVSSDGREREVDAIVFGTGFHVTDIPAAKLLQAGDGTSLEDAWGGSPSAYLGTTVAGFPNLFFLLGPNTGLGHNSVVYMVESQIAYVIDALRTMSARGAGTIEVSADAQAAFNVAVDQRMVDTVWSSGCASWYIDETGRNSTLWPDWTWRYRHRTARFDAERYRLSPVASAASPAGPAGSKSLPAASSASRPGAAGSVAA